MAMLTGLFVPVDEVFAHLSFDHFFSRAGVALKKSFRAVLIVNHEQLVEHEKGNRPAKVVLLYFVGPNLKCGCGPHSERPMNQVRRNSVAVIRFSFDQLIELFDQGRRTWRFVEVVVEHRPANQKQNSQKAGRSCPGNRVGAHFFNRFGSSIRPRSTGRILRLRTGNFRSAKFQRDQTAPPATRPESLHPATDALRNLP